MHQDISDDVMMISRDISEKHTSQNAINMKLGQYVLGEKMTYSENTLPKML